MLIVCEECGHRQEINVSERLRMDIDTNLGEQPRCQMCESDKLEFA
jgi:hypothetical protein